MPYLVSLNWSQWRLERLRRGASRACVVAVVVEHTITQRWWLQEEGKFKNNQWDFTLYCGVAQHEKIMMAPRQLLTEVLNKQAQTKKRQEKTTTITATTTTAPLAISKRKPRWSVNNRQMICSSAVKIQGLGLPFLLHYYRHFCVVDLW